LKKAIGDVKCLPDLHAELDSLVQEHQRIRWVLKFIIWHGCFT
jgi:hypothetical protein